MDTILVMLGAPGSGKGTQARLLAKELDVPIFDIGYLLRKTADDDPVIKEMMNSGHLLSDDFINDFVNGILVDVKTNFIVDGYPRTLHQAIFLDKILGARNFKVIKLEVPEKKLIERLSNRVSCFICGKIYNNTVDTCEECNIELNKRSDDALEVIERRLLKYQEQETQLVEFYHNNVIVIDADSPVEVVTKKILTEVAFYG